MRYRPMPKLLVARPPVDERESQTVQKLARSRHAPMDVILRVQMVMASWQGQRTTAIAAQLDCHPQTVRERLHRFNAEGVDGLQDHARPGRKRRISEAERSMIIALVGTAPPGRLVRESDGELRPGDANGTAHWTLNALTDRAQQQGIRIQRSQVRRILLDEGVRWRSVRSWMTSTDPEFAKKEPLL
jgi:transposase